MKETRERARRIVTIAGILGIAGFAAVAAGEPETVRAHVQARPGGPLVETEMGVHAVPTDLPSVPAAEAPLEDGELVLGVVVGGVAKACVWRPAGRAGPEQ